MKYFSLDLEAAAELEPVHVPADCCGVTILLRRNGLPIHYSMHAAEPGSVFSLEDLIGQPVAELIRQRERTLVPFRPPANGKPWLTIAICTRNRPQELERCLSTLVAVEDGALLDASTYEILVVDNAPSDDRTEVVARAFPGIRYVREAKPGLSFARNRGVLEASGLLVAYLDDDAVIDRKWLTGLQQAWMTNPEAAGFTGPILPLEMESTAQILLEGRGGFGHVLLPRRWPESASGSRLFPCGEACFGGGANMALRRDILLEVGGFDVLLGAGTPTLGGEDLDIFYRVIRSQRTWVFEPMMIILHQHRREYKTLRRQMYTWGVGYMSYIMKCYREDEAQRSKLLWIIVRSLVRKCGGVIASLLSLRGYKWPVDLAFAEFCGTVQGVLGVYQRSFRILDAAGHLRQLPLSGTKLVSSRP